ncbi:MAG: hypothetical protein Q9188_006946, partial [Gyalolechia gomerana]
MFDDGDDVSDVIDPVTALQFVKFQSRLLLLAGEGPYLKVFDHENAQLLNVKRIFESQAIHGIVVTDDRGYRDQISVAKILIWGGRCLRTGELREVTDEQPKLNISFGKECKAEDWILDACFRPRSNLIDVHGFLEECNTVLVTAHNVILTLYCDKGGIPIIKRITAGPRSMLYSACIAWAAEGKKILVASGTVFGKILFWSFSDSPLAVNAEIPIVSQLYYRLTGHEGSVFGVRISPELSREEFGERKRLLASCSDDRTVRIWDVSDFEDIEVLLDDFPDVEVGVGVPQNTGKKMLSEDRCVATVMGHSSRIWDVRFLTSKYIVKVLSFGEDSTAQVWQLDEKPAPRALSSDKHESLQLIHQQTYSYHSGKNIWASAILQRENDSHTICTGGADGRIVSHGICSTEEGTGAAALPRSWTMKDVANQLEENETLIVDGGDASVLESKTMRSKHIFDGFERTWIIKRNIRSALSTYPSGIFNGEATFERRSPTTSDYDEEHLYTEQGTFTADQGLSFTATRQYVYRYQRASDTISAWFVKPEGKSKVDYLFHEVCLDDTSALSNGHGFDGGRVVRANGYHLCVDDHYTPKYTFRLKHSILQDWKLAYQVKGPQKDYIAEASYVRKSEDDNLITAPPSEQTALSIAQAQKNRVRIPNDSEFGKDNFKSYVSLTQDSFMVTTAQGRVLLGSLRASRRDGRLEESCEDAFDIRWEMVGQCKELVSSSITTKVVGSELVLLSGNDGTIFLYDHLAKEIQPIAELGRKAALLYARKSSMENLSIFATCLGCPAGYVFEFPNTASRCLENGADSRPFLLALPASFIVTRAAYIGLFDLWIVGSRRGALAFYNASLLVSNTESQPNKVVYNVHGEDAITVIECLPETEGGHILTAGRDGHYAVHDITYSQSGLEKPEVVFQTVHRTTPPFGPNIEGAIFNPPSRCGPQTHELVLWGFRGKSFVVWNASRNVETVDIECGGAHRNWTYTPFKHASNGGIFVWTKASVCYVHTQARASHRFLQSGGHGREIKAMATSTLEADGGERRYIATGSEDTAIRIWSYNREYGSKARFNCIGTFTEHTSGIQQLRWSDDGRLLFSAAGCEELFAWRVQPVPIIGIGAVCKAVCPKVTEDSDLRIMDFCFEELNQPNGEMVYIISVIYSDSSLRIFHFTSLLPNPQFTLLETASYTTNCLTQILHLHPAPLNIPTQDYLCTASSDGHIAFWPSSSSSIQITPTNTTPDNDPLRFSNRHPIHQSSVKCMTATRIHSQPSNQHLLLTGGDDGALGITRLVFPPDTENGETIPTKSLPTCSTLLIPKAHAAAINAVAFLQTLSDPEGARDKETNVFATSGNDQRVKVWGVTCEESVPGTGG